MRGCPILLIPDDDNRIPEPSFTIRKESPIVRVLLVDKCVDDQQLISGSARFAEYQFRGHR
jgi:hypothetical protein